MVQTLVLPTAIAIEAAWDRYRELMSAIVDHPELAINRQHMEETARAEQAWKNAFLAREGGH